MDSKKIFPRDLSWLSFNERILQEAGRANVPLYERIRFLAIYSSNLHEFYRVRVATHRRLAQLSSQKISRRLDVDPKVLLRQIADVVNQQLEQYGQILRMSIIPALEVEGIYLHLDRPLPEQLHDTLRAYFCHHVLAYLRIVRGKVTDNTKLFLEDHQPYLIFQFASTQWTYVNIPTALPRFYRVSPSPDKHHLVFLDDIIRLHADYLFPGDTVVGSYSVVLSRDADLRIEDEYEGNLVEKIKKQVAKRNLGQATRFLYDPELPTELLDQLQKAFQLAEEDLVVGGRYHNLDDFMALPNPLSPALEYDLFPPLDKTSLRGVDRLLNHLEAHDELLMFPYQTYNYVLRFFNEAAVHPEVTEINITLYRIAHHSQVAQALMSAAHNGKKVRVFVEVKARFDEENNLRWARRMEEAGVKIVYSMPNLKVHAKIALVKRKTAKGDTRYYAYLGTGNFNEKTARIYSDLALLTTHWGLAKDLASVFRFLYQRKEIKKIKHLLVAPFNMQSYFVGCIDREIACAQQGQPARITLKVNGLEEKQMIEKLYEASQAGVNITLLVRGICCLRPQLAGLSERITAIRIVDRFLEHARVIWFHNGGEEEMYLASADWMHRNLHRRIEVAFPVYDTTVREQIKQILYFQEQDTQQAVMLNETLHNVPRGGEETGIRAQEATYQWLERELAP